MSSYSGNQIPREFAALVVAVLAEKPEGEAKIDELYRAFLVWYREILNTALEGKTSCLIQVDHQTLRAAFPDLPENGDEAVDEIKARLQSLIGQAFRIKVFPLFSAGRPYFLHLTFSWEYYVCWENMVTP